MKKVISNKITLWILVVVTAVVAVFYVCMLARPVAYEMPYEFAGDMTYEIDGQSESEYFEISMVFHKNNKVTIKNSNFEEAFENYYYSKDGYLVLCMAVNEQDYAKEVEELQKNWDEVIKDEMASYTVNAFRLASVGETIDMDQICQGTVWFAIIAGVLEAVLLILTILCAVNCKKAKAEA